MCCLISIGCSPSPLVKTVEVPVSSKGCGKALLREQNDLFAQNIRLKHQLKICNQKH